MADVRRTRASEDAESLDAAAPASDSSQEESDAPSRGAPDVVVDLGEEAPSSPADAIADDTAGSARSAPETSSERLKTAIASLTAAASVLAALAGWSAALLHARGIDADRQAITELMRLVETRTANESQISGTDYPLHMQRRRLLAEAEVLSDPTRKAYATGAARVLGSTFRFVAEEQQGPTRVFDLDAALQNALLLETEAVNNPDPEATIARADASHHRSILVVRWVLLAAIAVVLLAVARFLSPVGQRRAVVLAAVLIAGTAAGVALDAVVRG